jgi:ankyrin repeat protein
MAYFRYLTVTQGLLTFIFPFICPCIFPVNTWAWVKLGQADSPTYFQEKAFISEKEWTFPTLGTGKLSQNGGTFIANMSPSQGKESEAKKDKMALSYKLSALKQKKPLNDHVFDYILSNDQTNLKVVYFSEKSDPKNKKACALNNYHSGPECNLKEAITDACWVVEFKEVFAKHNPDILKHIEWNINQLTRDPKNSNESHAHKTIASVKKDRNGLFFQSLQSTSQNPLLVGYAATILALEVADYLRQTRITNQLRLGARTVGVLGLGGLGLFAPKGLKALGHWLQTFTQNLKPTISGRTKLIQAALDSNLDLVIRLFNERLDNHNDTPNTLQKWINTTDSQGNSALHAAIAQGNSAIVEYLLTKSASTRIVDAHGWTPLFHSILRGNQAIFELLLKHKADVHQGSPWKPKEGSSQIEGLTLFKATSDEISCFSSGDPEKIKALTDDVTPARAAAALGRLEMLEKLHDNYARLHERTRPPSQGWNALDVATLENRVKIVEYLLRNGADPNEPSGQSSVLPLQYAATYGKQELFDTLIAGGANILNSGNTNNTVLICAARNGRLEMVKDILQKIEKNGRLSTAEKADFINMTNTDEKTALGIAIMNKNLPMVRSILSFASPVQINSSHGWTPLFHSILTGNQAIFDFLIAQKVDVNKGSPWKPKEGSTQIEGITLFQAADQQIQFISCKEEARVKALTAHVTPSQAAAALGRLEMLKTLEAKGAKLNERTPPTGWNTLDVATLENRVEIVKYLLKKGANPNEPSGQWDMLPLFYAARYAKRELFDALISDGADILKTAHGNSTVLIGAARSDQLEMVQHIVQTLSKCTTIDSTKKSDFLNTKNNEGKTALGYAIAKVNIAMVESILSLSPDLEIDCANRWTPLFYSIIKGNQAIFDLLIAKKADVNKDSPWEPKEGSTEIDRVTLFQASSEQIMWFAYNDPVKIKALTAHVTPAQAAAALGNLEMLRKLHENKANLFKRTPPRDEPKTTGWNALDVATLENQAEIVQYLLKNRSNPEDLSNTDNRLLLSYAAAFGKKDLFNALIESEAHILTTAHSGSTVLIEAARGGQLEMVQGILQRITANTTLDAKHKETFLNAKDTEGKSALGYAIMKNNVEMVRALLNNSPNLEISCANGWTPLFQSIVVGDQAIFDLLIANKADVNKGSPWKPKEGSTEIDGIKLFRATPFDISWFSSNDNAKVEALTANVTPVQAAAALGRMTMLGILQAKGANLHQRTSTTGWNTLEIATLENRVEIVEYLLKNGANPNEPSGKWNISPLHKAAVDGKKELFDTLIAHGADIRRPLNTHFTVLMLAAAHGHLKMAEHILKKVNNMTTLDAEEKLAFLNAKDDNRKTALGHAISKKNPAMTQILLRHSPTPEIESAYGWTPLFQSIIVGNQAIFDLLIEQNVDVNKSCPWKPKDGSTEIDGVKLFQANAIEIKWFLCNDQKKIEALTADITPIQAAAALGRLEMLKTLEKKGAKLHERNSTTDWNTLEFATVENRLNIVEYLLQNGANSNESTGNWNMVPLRYAAAFGKKELFDTLLAGGADIFHSDSTGNSVLTTSAKFGKLEMVRHILQRISEKTTLSVEQKITLVNMRNSEQKTALEVAREDKRAEICTAIEDWLKNCESAPKN